MRAILRVTLGIALIQYSIVWYGYIQHWFDNRICIYTISSAIVLIVFSLRHFHQKNLNIKNNLLLVIVVVHLVFTSAAKYKLEISLLAPLIVLMATIVLLLLELKDWITRKPKSQRANAVQLTGLIAFLLFMVFKIKHYPFAVALMAISHLSLIAIALDLIFRSRNARRNP